MYKTDFDKNLIAWNQRTLHHLNSSFYDLPGFLSGKNSLKEIEMNILGNVSGKKILHLQCHFGQDSISLARMGAEVTAVDLSDVAISKARELAIQTETSVNFICCNLYDLPKNLEADFDYVFTSYGTIAWLPDLKLWAALIHRYLRPGAVFAFVEFHPVVWMFDNDFTKVTYPYMDAARVVETEQGTYADRNADLTTEMVTWNHGIGNVIASLLDVGLRISSFEEFDYSPYDCFSGMREREPGKYVIEKFDSLIPLVYALTATKTND